EAGHSAGTGEARGLALGHLGGVYHAPAAIEADIIEQEVDRTSAEPSLDLRHLLHLLSRMDVERAVRQCCGQRGKLVGRGGAQRMGCSPNPGIGGQGRARGLDQFEKGVEIVAEALLAARQRSLSRAAVTVED